MAQSFDGSAAAVGGPGRLLALLPARCTPPRPSDSPQRCGLGAGGLASAFGWHASCSSWLGGGWLSWSVTGLACGEAVEAGARDFVVGLVDAGAAAPNGGSSLGSTKVEAGAAALECISVMVLYGGVMP